VLVLWQNTASGQSGQHYCTCYWLQSELNLVQAFSSVQPPNLTRNANLNVSHVIQKSTNTFWLLLSNSRSFGQIQSIPCRYPCNASLLTTPPPVSLPCLLPQGAELFLGNAGTAMRPLTAAVAAAGRGRFVLDGVARMRERPIADLVDGLVQLGVDAKCTMGTGCPPVEVNAQGLPSGKVCTAVP
jgi:hypothetical protein